MFKCPYCKRADAVKAGIRKNKGGLKQRFVCQKCEQYFVADNAFKRFRNKKEVITVALDLRAKGLSLADIVDHLDQHYRVKVTRKTILDWQKKFKEKVKGFVESLTPFVGGIIHADEVFLKVKKEWNYYWDAIDYDTKFVVGEHFSKIREEQEAMIFLQYIKNHTNQVHVIHTDNSYDYPIPIKKVFGKQVRHVHYPAWKKKFKNNPIERLQNTIKQRTKTFRSFDNFNTAKDFMEFWKIYYNLIRKHTTLNFITPAQAAGINLNLQRNRFLSLIEILKNKTTISKTH